MEIYFIIFKFMNQELKLQIATFLQDWQNNNFCSPLQLKGAEYKVSLF